MQIFDRIQNGKRWLTTHREKLLWAVYAVLTLLLITPRYEDTEWIYIPRMLACVAVVVWAVFIRRRLSPAVLAIGLQQGYVLLVTVVRGADTGTALVHAAYIGGMVLLYELMQSERKVFLSSQMFCFELMIYVNLFTVFRYPGGMYENTAYFTGPAAKRFYFLGYYNNFTHYCIPALLILALYPADTRLQKLRKALLAAAIYVTAVKIWSGAVLVTLIAMGVAWLLRKKLPSIFNFYSVWSIHIVFFVGIICLQLQNLFRWLIDGVLDKWESLTSRMEIWNKVQEAISQAWLFGHGQVEIPLRQKEMGTFALHAHNLLLEMLYQGGIVNVVLFIGIIYIAGRRVYKYRGTMESKLITIAAFGWCIDMLVEAFPCPILMTIFVTAYYSNRDALEPGGKDPLDVPKWDEWLRARLTRE